MRMRSSLARALIAGILSALVLGCADDEPPGNPIVLGSVYNLTGFQAVLDVPSWYGSTIAASEINANGGVLGRDVSLVLVNGNSEPATLSAEAENLLDQNSDVIALFGLSDTDMVLATAPVAAQHQRVFLSSGATSPKLPEQVPDYLFLACFGDNVQAAAGAEWAYDALGARTAVVLFDPNETYPLLLQGYFATRFAELGATITATESIDPRTDPITLPVIGDVDLVFLSVETAEDAVRVIPLLRASGYAGPILGGDGYDAASTWSAFPDIASVYFTTHVYLGADSENPNVTAFLSAYAEAYPDQEPSAFAALGYDAVGLLAAAMSRAGDATPAAVASGLSGLEGYRGVTGTISFLGGNRIPTKSVTILQIADARQQFVTEVIPTSVPNP